MGNRIQIRKKEGDNIKIIRLIQHQWVRSGIVKQGKEAGKFTGVSEQKKNKLD